MFTEDGTHSRSHGLRPEVVARHVSVSQTLPTGIADQFSSASTSASSAAALIGFDT